MVEAELGRAERQPGHCILGAFSELLPEVELDWRLESASESLRVGESKRPPWPWLLPEG